MNRNISDFCVFILHHETLMKSLISFHSFLVDSYGDYKSVPSSIFGGVMEISVNLSNEFFFSTAEICLVPFDNLHIIHILFFPQHYFPVFLLSCVCSFL